MARRRSAQSSPCAHTVTHPSTQSFSRQQQHVSATVNKGNMHSMFFTGTLSCERGGVRGPHLATSSAQIAALPRLVTLKRGNGKFCRQTLSVDKCGGQPCRPHTQMVYSREKKAATFHVKVDAAAEAARACKSARVFPTATDGAQCHSRNEWGLNKCV